MFMWSSVYTENTRSWTNEPRAALQSETRIAYIYQMKSQPLGFDYWIKPFQDLGLIWINHAALTQKISENKQDIM